MSKYLLSVVFVMVMAILPAIARKNLSQKWKMRRLINGLKFRKQPSAIRLINRKAKEVMLEKESILVRKNI